MTYKHQSVRDYVAAIKQGDTAEADRILRDTCSRFVNYQASGDEATELGGAAMETKTTQQ